MADTPAIVSGQTAPVAAVAAPSSSPSGAQAPVRDLASQFEGLLLSQMMRDLKTAMVDDDKSDGFDASPLGDAITSDLGLSLSRAGGFGLAQSLSAVIAKQAGVGQGQDTSVLSNTLQSLPPSLPVLPGPGGSGGSGSSLVQEEEEAGAVAQGTSGDPDLWIGLGAAGPAVVGQ